VNRLTRDEYGCLLALSASTRSEDCSTRVGAAAMTKEGRIIGLSYNGLAAGMIKPSWMDEEENRIKKGLFFIHAEQNLAALLKKGECDTIYTTISPCVSCANTIIAHGVNRVVYLKEYHRCVQFKEIFDFYKIQHKMLDEIEKSHILDELNRLIISL
jgi:dCMP deaminase